VRRGRERLAARWSRRSPASLDWEIGLLDHLARHGLRVPEVVPALDGRRHVDGVVVQAWLDGTPPGPADWAASGWRIEPGYARRQLALLGQPPGLSVVRPPRQTRPGR